MIVANETHIRWMIRSDLPQAVVIDQVSMGVYPTWNEQDFIRFMRERGNIGMVALPKQGSKDIIGFCMYALLDDIIDIERLAVRPEYMRTGIGTTIIDKMKNKLTKKRPCLEINIKESNTDAQLFLKAQGFKASLIRNFYDDPVEEDAYRFSFNLGEIR